MVARKKFALKIKWRKQFSSEHFAGECYALINRPEGNRFDFKLIFFFLLHYKSVHESFVRELDLNESMSTEFIEKLEKKRTNKSKKRKR